MNLKILAWPLNLSAFELGIGFGIGKSLQLIFEPTKPPLWAVLVGVFIVVLLSSFVVCRYFPSDAVINKGDSIGVMAWINLSMLLAAIIPTLSVLYFNSLLFWILSVLIAGAKAIHSLEEKHRERGGLYAIQGSNIPPAGTKLTFLTRYIFSPNPDAYALRPIPTAIFFSVAALGVTIGYQGGKSHASFGVYLLTGATSVSLLSR
jgi:hypothetical protein